MATGRSRRYETGGRSEGGEILALCCVSRSAAYWLAQACHRSFKGLAIAAAYLWKPFRGSLVKILRRRAYAVLDPIRDGHPDRGADILDNLAANPIENTSQGSRLAPGQGRALDRRAVGCGRTDRRSLDRRSLLAKRMRKPLQSSRIRPRVNRKRSRSDNVQ